MLFVVFGMLANFPKNHKGARFSSVDAPFEARCVLHMRRSLRPIDACAGTSRRSLVSQGLIKYACGIANICINVTFM